MGFGFGVLFLSIALASSADLLNASSNFTAEDSTVTKACGVSRSLIVMSRGRSGSSVLCETIQRHLGYRSPQPDGEILGSSSHQMKVLSDPLSFVRHWICEFGSKSGFYMKWKPEYWAAEYIDLLRWMASQRIPVVYNVRNPLDVYLSRLKHAQNQSVATRCHPSDKQCLEMHHSNQLVEVPIPSLIRALSRTSSANSKDLDSVRDLLIQEKVNYHPVHYENLQSDDNSTRLSAWRQMFEFLSPSRDWSKLTVMDTISDTMIRTSSISQTDKIVNYDEVRQALQGTRFEQFLH